MYGVKSHIELFHLFTMKTSGKRIFKKIYVKIFTHKNWTNHSSLKNEIKILSKQSFRYTQYKVNLL